jgi:hypothetical protein
MQYQPYQQYPTPNTSTPQPQQKNVAFKYGLIIGLIFTVIAIIASVFTTLSSLSNAATLDGSQQSAANAVSNLMVSGLVGILIFFLSLIAYLIAGILAARKTARVRTGTFAGMWTGGVYGVVSWVAGFIILFTLTMPQTNAIYQRAGYTAARIAQQQAIEIGAEAFGGVFILAFAIGLGAGMGALGGLIGRSRARGQGQPGLYQEAPYPVFAQPPYPQQPPQYGQAPYPPQYGQQPYGDPNAQMSSPYNNTPQTQKATGSEYIPQDAPRQEEPYGSYENPYAHHVDETIQPTPQPEGEKTAYVQPDEPEPVDTDNDGDKTVLATPSTDVDRTVISASSTGDEEPQEQPTRLASQQGETPTEDANADADKTVYAPRREDAE